MPLYSGTTQRFVDDATRNRVATLIGEEFFRYYGYKPPESEVRSWKNSLRAMADAVEIAGLEDHGVAVEVQLPLSSGRLDCMFTGRDGDDRGHAVIVELKQWESVGESYIDECVLVAYGRGKDKLHPSHQAAGYATYLRDTHSSFGDDGFGISACAFLHNMSDDPSSPLFASRFEHIMREAPLFTGDQIDDLATSLRGALAGGDGMPILEEVMKGRYRPQKKLLDHTAEMIASQPAFTLLDEQRVAFNDVLRLVEEAHRDGTRSAVLIRGGPGTGKSLIAVNLIGELSRRGLAAEHATGSKAFTESLRKRVGSRARAQFKYFNQFGSAHEDPLDVLICDEAHRIRESSAHRFTKAADRTGLPQIEELLRAAKTTVFLIDDLQTVRPGEIGSSDEIRAAADRMQRPLVEHELEMQFRCGGSDAFVGWVEDLLDIRRSPFGLWDPNEEFAFDVLDSPEELDAMIRSRAQEGLSARLMAGFCWPWSNPREDGTLEDDVVVGSWRRPWNARAESGRLARGIPKSDLWAIEPGGIDQVGCIYTAQGFEFDYAGIIWGNDLVWRPRDGWIAQAGESYDSVVKRAAKDGPMFLALLKQTYRVLLTRGLRGCYVHFTDEQTRDFVLGRIRLPED